MKCRVCGKPLTGEGAFLGIGPVCRKHRAEALQMSLIETPNEGPPLPTKEEWDEAQEFEIVDFDKLTGRVSKKQEAPMD